MAYMDFSQPLAAAGSGTVMPAIRDRIRPQAPGFTRTEWQIIELARTDGLASLREPGRWARFLTLIFGARPRLTLASTRLEALRRLAVEAWHRGFAVRPSFITAFRDAGFSDGQLELLLSAISAARTTFRRRSFA
jgi:hypothetical protein